ncbi:Uncharacterised protein [Mycobacteroides abscessus subsp. abscessus]|uniref:hypothetical protein n=1 Tax=Mycobacteroides abscessus TaxID=36809 RepID=UPI000929A958|nr:hypothetical protein [Mycobacteroides abscessus]SIH24180.1 Uncharacterised protein [Mycobacteroides abscessus subsp. abscessus]
MLIAHPVTIALQLVDYAIAIAIGLIKLTGSVPSDLRIIGIRPTTGLTSKVQLGDSLCHFGYALALDKIATQCGAVTQVTPTKVAFDAPAIGCPGK